MKKNYAIFGSALMVAASALTATAQQLPNAGFEENWGDCTPWTSPGNSATQGTTPAPWTIAQVIGATGGLGKTTVGEATDGYKSVSAVKIYNKSLFGQNIPGYFTLGTSWSTSIGMGGSKDGGTFGGIEFGYRPDAVSFMYTRSHGTAKPDEIASVVAYLWKGTYSQADVPGNIVLSGSPTTCTMIDRDRNILGMTTSQGGAVTATEGAACIAKIDYAIEGDADSWTNKLIEFEYLTEDTPEKFNIIFAAGDYWSTAAGKDNTLCVDDVKLIYYSRLSGVSVNGIDVPDFAPNNYEYTMTADMPTSADAVVATLYGQAKGASVDVALDDANNKATITVTNAGADVDGETSHVYTISFTSKPDPSNAVEYTGKLVIEMGGGVINPDDETQYKVFITPLGDDKCDFSLPNFSLDLGGGPTLLGDIAVENCTMTNNADGTIAYTGQKSGLSLLGGAIMADVDLNGTETAEGALNMNINVIWTNGGDIPITVTFNGNKANPAGVTGITVNDENAQVEYYNLQGIRVENPEGGVYIRRQGSKISKVLVK